MKRVSEIKQRREERFYRKRMKASKEVQKIRDRKELKEDIDLLSIPLDEREAVKDKLAMKEKMAEGGSGSSSMAVDDVE
eukprot:SAG22_NODE_13941_length_390_cov_0.852234_1_plen_79_part_00